LLHPAAGRGVHYVSDSLVRPFGQPSTRRSWTRRSGESSPVAKTLRSVPLLGSLPCRHRASPFRARPRSPTGVPSRRSTWIRSRVATPRLPPRRPQGLSPPRSPLRPRRLSASHRSMLPWALDRRRFPDAAALSRRPDVSVLDVSPCGANRFGVPDPKSRGRQGVSALSGSCGGACLVPKDLARGDGRFQPEGRCAPCLSRPSEERIESRRVRLRCFLERSISASSHIRPEWDVGGSAPRGEPTASFRTPEGARSRRVAPSLRRGPPRPSACSEESRRWFELRRSFLPRLPAYMKDGCSPHALDHPKVTRCMRTARASRLEDAASNPHVEPPKEFVARPNRAPPGGGRLPARGPGISQQAASAGLGPDSHLLHRTARLPIRGPDSPPRPEGRRADAEAPGVRLVPHIPPAGGDPPRAPECSCRDGPWPTPGDPDRSRDHFFSAGAEALSEIRPALPDRAVKFHRVDGHVKERFRGTRSSR
jgi:hypothetical protein